MPVDAGTGDDQRCDDSHPRRRHQVAGLPAEGAPALESGFLRRRGFGGTVVLDLRQSGRGPARVGPSAVGGQPAPASHRHQRPLRQAEGRHAAASVPSRNKPGAVLPRHRPVRRHRNHHDLVRGVLPPEVVAVRHRVLHSESRRAAVGQSPVSRRRRRRHLAGHRRDAHLQHARRILQSGLTRTHGLSGRTGRLGSRRPFLLQRS